MKDPLWFPPPSPAQLRHLEMLVNKGRRLPVSATGGSDLSSQRPALQRTLAAFFTLRLSQAGALWAPGLSSLRILSGTSAGGSGRRKPAASTAAAHLQPSLLKAPRDLCLHRLQLPQSLPAPHRHRSHPSQYCCGQPSPGRTAYSWTQHGRPTSAIPSTCSLCVLNPSPGPHTCSGAQSRSRLLSLT